MDFAPEIMRQRLLIEGFYNTKDVTKDTIKDYFTHITGELQLRAYGEPIIFSPGGEGKEENQGYDAFIPLIDSGICLYVWTGKKFASTVIYTCKSFDEKKAVQAFNGFFDIQNYIQKSF